MVAIRTKKVSLRLTKDEYAKLKKEAGRRGMYVAQYVRWLLWKK